MVLIESLREADLMMIEQQSARVSPAKQHSQRVTGALDLLLVVVDTSNINDDVALFQDCGVSRTDDLRTSKLIRLMQQVAC